MGWVVMSERELGRIEVLSCVVEGRMSVVHGAEVLGLSPRQVQRLLRTFREDGAPALRHKARGRPSNNRLRDSVRDLALALVRESYVDFGPTLAAEKLAERHGLTVSRETLRKWMAEDGLWLSRRQRRQFHQPRLRRERLGELVQIDGSKHRWFEDRGPACTLLVFIDDATSRLMRDCALWPRRARSATSRPWRATCSSTAVPSRSAPTSTRSSAWRRPTRPAAMA
jgi:transposase